VVKEVKEKGWDGKDGDKLQWSFAGALLYAVTVVTTIGKSFLVVLLLPTEATGVIVSASSLSFFFRSTRELVHCCI